MATFNQTFYRSDDDPHLVGDDLADKVMRYITYVSLVDTSELSVLAIGRTIVLSGFVPTIAEIGCVEEAAAAVIGVHLVDNRVKARRTDS